MHLRLTILCILALSSSAHSPSSRESLLKAVRKEPKVKEAIITDANVLYAAVIDDGTRRDGYAAYLCELVREHDRTVNRVKIVEYGTIVKHPDRDNAFGILLGESWCK